MKLLEGAQHRYDVQS